METVEQFLARGGKINKVAEGERGAEPDFDPTLCRCRCGCEGNYTDHSMRAGESGRCPSVIIR